MGTVSIPGDLRIMARCEKLVSLPSGGFREYSPFDEGITPYARIRREAGQVLADEVVEHPFPEDVVETDCEVGYTERFGGLFRRAGRHGQRSRTVLTGFGRELHGDAEYVESSIP